MSSNCNFVFNTKVQRILNELMKNFLRFFSVADGGNGALNVSSRKTLDREGDQGKFLYVPIYVRDVRGYSAIRFLPIEIGDRNDNPMTDGSSTIHVYNYKGNYYLNFVWLVIFN